MPPAAPLPKGATRVTVACKIPHGIIMQLCKQTKYFEETRQGTVERVRYDRYGERVFIRGTSYPVNPPAGFPERHPLVGGYAMTPNIDAEFWSEWLDQNKRSAMVLNSLIFAMPTSDAVRGMARERAAIRTGLEPLDISVNADGKSNDPRVPRPANPAIGVVVKADVAA